MILQEEAKSPQVYNKRKIIKEMLQGFSDEH